MVKFITMKEVKGNVVMGKEDFEELVGGMESLAETLEIIGDENPLRQIKESEEASRVSELKNRRVKEAVRLRRGKE